MEKILLVGAKRTPLNRLRRELEDGAYRVLVALGSAEALSLLAQESINLIVVSAIPGKATSKGERESTATDGYQMCQQIRTWAEEKRTPVLLVASIWEPSILARGSETGADYFLFAPYQEQSLLRSVRSALLNGAAPPVGEAPGIEVVHQDRMFTVGTSRERLARQVFSLFEELQENTSAMCWSRAEAAAFRRQLRYRSRRPTPDPAPMAEILQGIAHDLANLMERVTAAARAEEEPPRAESGVRRMAMNAALSQARILLSALQDWTRWEKRDWEPEPVQVEGIVREALETALLPLFAPSIKVCIQLGLGGLPPILSNQTLLLRCLSNLIWNAVQAMPTGGTLTILGRIRKNQVVVTVSDSGVGITKEDQKKIFDPHFSTKQGHSGMGLPLVQSLVQRTGGNIRFSSRPGRGSAFSLLYPVAEWKPETSTAPASKRRLNWTAH
jgi:signal transduction histidine kinase